MTQTVKRVTLVTLAIAEMVTLVVAFGTVGYFVDQMGEYVDDSQTTIDLGTFGRHEFFLFALAVGFFVSISSLVISVAGLQDKIHCAIAMLTIHVFCALAILVSSALLTKTTMTYDLKKLHECQNFKNSSSNARCYQLIIGVAFGFVSLALFIANTIVYFFTLTRNVGIRFINMADVTQ